MSTKKAPHMNATNNLKRIIAGTLLSGGVAVAGLGLAAGAAQAQPGPAPLRALVPGRLAAAGRHLGPDRLPRLSLWWAGLFNSYRGDDASSDVRRRPVRIVSLDGHDQRSHGFGCVVCVSRRGSRCDATLGRSHRIWRIAALQTLQFKENGGGRS